MCIFHEVGTHLLCWAGRVRGSLFSPGVELGWVAGSLAPGSECLGGVRPLQWGFGV